MRIRLCGFFAVLVVSVALASNGEAQLRPWEISIAGGPSFPLGELADEADTGYHVQGSVGFRLPSLPVGLRVDALWQEFGDPQGGYFRQIGGLANATFGVPMVAIEPYALAGVGYLRSEAPEVEHSGHTHGGTQNILGVNAGAGVEFPFVGLRGFLEARVLNLVGGSGATEFRSVPVTVGIRF